MSQFKRAKKITAGQWRWVRLAKSPEVPFYGRSSQWHIADSDVHTLCDQLADPKDQTVLGEFTPTERCPSCSNAAAEILGLRRS